MNPISFFNQEPTWLKGFYVVALFGLFYFSVSQILQDLPFTTTITACSCLVMSLFFSRISKKSFEYLVAQQN